MAISSVCISNFKGVFNQVNLPIKPITIFVGANSSGKSSCLHALAALNQTVKVTNDRRALVLDDEFATVHLGRFIEIIHSRSYQDMIELGIGLSGVAYPSAEYSADRKRPNFKFESGSIRAAFRFKCTKRTQDIHLETAQYDYNDTQVQARRTSGDLYSVTSTRGATVDKMQCDRDSAFFFSPRPPKGPQDAAEYWKFQSFLALQRHVKVELSKVLYLGPFRQGPLRRYATRGGDPKEVGALGESTITMLANETVQSRTRTHVKQVQSWLKHLGLAKGIEVARIGRSDLFDVSMTLSDGHAFPLADLGYGLSQILPVLTQCSFADKGSTLLFEQPEIHLHTLAARQLADVFIETANEKEASIIIETHSPELVKAFMVRQRERVLSPENFVVYRVVREGGESRIKALEFDEHHDIYDNWEKGISVP